jgi:hypothetical protein
MENKFEKPRELSVERLVFQIEDDKILWKREYTDGTEDEEWNEEDVDPNRPDLVKKRMEELNIEYVKDRTE